MKRTTSIVDIMKPYAKLRLCYTKGASSLWYPNGTSSPWLRVIDESTTMRYTVLDFSKVRKLYEGELTEKNFEQVKYPFGKPES